MHHYRRRKFLINKGLQWRLLAISLGHVMLFFIVVSFALFFPLIIDLGQSDTYSEKALQAANHMLYLHTYFWPAALFALFAICLHSIHISHKIAGPLYRFSHIFKALQNGTLPQPIRLRKGDYLLPEMETLNAMLRSLRERIGEIQATQTQLYEAITTCQQTVQQASQDDLTQRLKYLAEKGNALGDQLAHFKIAP
jgi:methyl-accepting chemotaxis protein